nr:MAG: putative maturation protein [Leviviridae sp.]
MTSRDRSRTVVVAEAGAATWTGVGTANGSYPARTMTERCIDVIDGTRNPHPLTITRNTNLGWRLYGVSRPTGGWIYNGISTTVVGVSSPPSTSEPSDNTTLSSTLARSNPNRQRVDVPVFLFELKDIPGLLKSWAHDIKYAKRWLRGTNKLIPDIRDLPRWIAEKNLEWQFGVQPFYSDMAKILGFQQSVEKKLNQLRKLQLGGSAGGIAVVWDDVVKSTVKTGYVTGLYSESNTYAYFLETTRKKWGACRWIPTVSTPPRTDTELQALALRLTFGLDISFSTLWEAMPWSWLIDWFSNVGDLMSLSRNTVPVRHDGSCVMLQTDVKIVDWRHTGGPGVFSAEVNRYPVAQSKSRKLVGSAVPIPEFNLPFLNGKQLSILGSLAVTRRVPSI